MIRQFITTPLWVGSIGDELIAITPECLGLKGLLIFGILAAVGLIPWQALWWSGVMGWSLARLGILMLLLSAHATEWAWWYHDVGAVLHFAVLLWLQKQRNNHA